MTEAEYFAELFARADRATPLAYKAVLFRDKTGPLRSDCHGNVDRWVAENPEWRPVRGWTVSLQPPGAMLHAHSVVRDPKGGLVEITYDEPLDFLEHRGSLDYSALIDGRAQVFWPSSSSATMNAHGISALI